MFVSFSRVSVLLVVLTTLVAGCKTTQEIQTQEPVEDSVVVSIPPEPVDEFRGFNIQPELWIGGDALSMTDKIETIFENVAKANFNATFFKVRENGTTYYPSCIEPWSGKLNYKTPGFDPLRLAIEAARKNKLTIYAELDLLSIIKENHPPGIDEHLWFRHGPGATPDSVWILMNNNQQPSVIDGKIVLDPGLPEVKTYLKDVILKLIENYNLDGFCFDISGFPTDNINMDNSLPGNSLAGILNEKTGFAGSLMDLLEDIVVEAMLVKPYLVNSITFRGEKVFPQMVHCLEEGIADFIIPEVEIDTTSLNQANFYCQKEQIPGEVKWKNIFPALVVKKIPVKNEVIANAYDTILADGGTGMVVKYMDLNERNAQIDYHHFDQLTDFPKNLKQVKPEQVIGLDVSGIFQESYHGEKVFLSQANKAKLIDSEGKIGYITSLPDTIELETSVGSFFLPTRFWSIPYKYAVQPDNQVARVPPWVELRRMPPQHTHSQEFDFLFKTDYPATAWINDDSLKIYKTGIFFNEVILKEGKNRVRGSVLTPDSRSVFYEQEFVYEKIDESREAFPLWIDEKSVLPESDLDLLPEDVVRISFQGSLGQDGYIAVNPGRLVLDCSREDYDDYSLYQVDLPLQKLDPGSSYNLTLGITSTPDTPEIHSCKLDLPIHIRVSELYDFPMVRVVKENSRLTYNLGPIRLGGPIRSELGQGIIMKTNGKIGESYRIRLNKVETGMIHQGDVEILPPGTVQPEFYITNMACGPGRGGDLLSIPYLEPVPYMVYPDPDQNRIVITLFGVKTSSTWITHNRGRKIIDKVTWKQTTPETYEIYVNLKTSKIWGYTLKKQGKRLLFYVKHPPGYDLKKRKPLSGLKIAIEAGHGGRSTGAIGLSGLLEKNINLDLSFRLGELCKSKGAEILQVREADIDMSLLEKRDIAESSDADMLISIHANAAGGGYLRVPGTSTYYHNPFWAPLAEEIYNRMLELDLEQFGVVGSFNYTVIRVSQMPSILVEQAFMSHAEDEEKLADPGFRQKMAEKIYEGIIDYLEYMEE